MISVAVLGATGMVGQRFVKLLANHELFEISDLAASSRSAGKPYRKAAKWYLGEIPENVKEMKVKEIDPNKIRAEIVFSALPSSIAREVEPKFARQGFVVASNASAYRMEEDVPLVIPEVNPEHLGLVEVQKEKRKWEGFIVTNPNCTTIMAVLSLKPIFDNFGLTNVFISSMQALSGAGYSGVPSMAIVDNLIPFISKEEEKVETETLKLFGNFDGERIRDANFKVSASCTRVNVTDGHTEAIFVKTEKGAEPNEIKKVMQNFKALPQRLKLPTAPQRPIIVREEEDRPQPRLDRNAGKGMSITVGRIRKDPIFDVKYIALGHNTIRGAAGASVLNAELLIKNKII